MKTRKGRSRAKIRNLDSQGMQAFKEKQNAEEREKNRRKSETKRNPKKKQVKVKMKRNKEG